MPGKNVTHRLVMSTLFLLIAGAVVVAAILTSGPASSEVPGTPSPTMSGDMPGMNHGLAEMGRSTGVGRSVG